MSIDLPRYDTQTIDDFGRLVPNTTQFPSSAGGAGFAPLSTKIHAHGLKFGIWIMGGVPRMAVEAKSKIKGSQFTAADIAIVGDGAGSMDCPWNRWLVSLHEDRLCADESSSKLKLLRTLGRSTAST